MKEIAIKGNAFRKEEVIHALINIGGHNPYNFTGEREDCYYVLNRDGIIMGAMYYDAMQVTSLECFCFSDKDQEFSKYLSDCIIKQL